MAQVVEAFYYIRTTCETRSKCYNEYVAFNAQTPLLFMIIVLIAQACLLYLKMYVAEYVRIKMYLFINSLQSYSLDFAHRSLQQLYYADLIVTILFLCHFYKH